MKLNKLIVGVAAAGLIVSACGGGEQAADMGLKVVATTSILGDVVESIVGDNAVVEVLMAPGIDPHDFSPSARQVADINTADLVVANGLHLEESFDDVLVAASDDGVNVLEVGPAIDPIPFDDSMQDHQDKRHEQGADDPHFWHDPVRMSTAVGVIADALAEVDPSHDWRIDAASYQDDLAALDGEVRETLSSIPADRRVLVTNHAAFGYFAARYDFTVAGVVVPGGSTLAEPSAADLSDLVRTLRQHDVNAIFVENTASPALAETVAGELGSDVIVAQLYSDSLSDVDGPAATYVELMRTNAETIASALTAVG